MINEIIEAISVALNEEFGDEYEIYRESVRQDLKEPCFFIQGHGREIFRGHLKFNGLEAFFG